MDKNTLYICKTPGCSEFASNLSHCPKHLYLAKVIPIRPAKPVYLADVQRQRRQAERLKELLNTDALMDLCAPQSNETA